MVTTDFQADLGRETGFGGAWGASLTCPETVSPRANVFCPGFSCENATSSSCLNGQQTAGWAVLLPPGDKAEMGSLSADVPFGASSAPCARSPSAGGHFFSFFPKQKMGQPTTVGRLRIPEYESTGYCRPRQEGVVTLTATSPPRIASPQAGDVAPSCP